MVHVGDINRIERENYVRRYRQKSHHIRTFGNVLGYARHSFVLHWPHVERYLELAVYHRFGLDRSDRTHRHGAFLRRVNLVVS